MAQGFNQFRNLFSKLTESKYSQRFRQVKQIGNGAYANVVRGIDTQNNKKSVAIKIHAKNMLQHGLFIDLQRQIKNLKLVNSLEQKRYFVQYYQAFEIVTQQDYPKYFCLVFQLCHSSLDTLIRDKQKLLQIPIDKRIQMCLKISKGIEVLHKNNILHRDLKPANILLKLNKETNQYDVVISDFGHTKAKAVQMTALKGTTQYADPSIRTSQDYGFQWDIYSLGLIFLEILEGKFLFEVSQQLMYDPHLFGQKLNFCLNNLSKTLSQFKIDEALKKIIEGCLILSIQKRSKIKQIIDQFEQYLSNKNFITNQKRSTTQTSPKKIQIQYLRKNNKDQNPKQIIKAQNPQASNEQNSKNNQKEKQQLKQLNFKKYRSERKIQQNDQLNKMYYKRMSQKDQKQIQALKINSKVSRKEQKVYELVKMKKQLGLKKYQIENRLAILSLIDLYRQKVLKIKKIQDMAIDQTIKKQLIVFLFLNLTSMLNQEYERTKQSTIQQFIKFITQVFSPIVGQMRSQNFRFKFNKNARQLIMNFNIQSKQRQRLLRQYQQLIKEKCPHLEKQLRMIIQ